MIYKDQTYFSEIYVRQTSAAGSLSRVISTEQSKAGISEKPWYIFAKSFIVDV